MNSWSLQCTHTHTDRELWKAVFYKSNAAQRGGERSLQIHPQLLQSFLIDVFLVLSKLAVSFLSCPLSPPVYSFISASGGTNKRKDFGFESTHDAPPNSKVSSIPALPRSRQRPRFSFTPSCLFVILSHVHFQTHTANRSAINFSPHEIHPHYGAPAGKWLTAPSPHLLVLCLFARIDSSVNCFNLHLCIRASLPSASNGSDSSLARILYL